MPDINEIMQRAEGKSIADLVGSLMRMEDRIATLIADIRELHAKHIVCELFEQWPEGYVCTGKGDHDHQDVCRHCCCDGEGNQTEDCLYHDHSDGRLCATNDVLDAYDGGAS